jgi:hypothetical protein
MPTTPKSDRPQVGDYWLDSRLPLWSEWRIVKVLAIDLLGEIVVESRTGKQHRYSQQEFTKRLLHGRSG